ncbi:MAG: S1 RNA-binding domain-containing protein [Anaerolineales bacterium]|nr:S1 RNA-binding domain-containing protein [Anaerolineales bacterium]
MTNHTEESGNSDATHPMAFLLSEELNLPAAGDIREGWVVEHRNNEILVDIGAKSEGIIPSQEVQELDKATLAQFEVGSQIHVYIVSTEDQHGNVVVSYTKAAAEQDWIVAEKLQQTQEVYYGKIMGHNRGGLLIKVGLLRGFVPNSQLSRERRQGNDLNGETSSKLIGKKIAVKVLEVDRKRNRLILSEKAAEQTLRQSKRAELLTTLKEGDTFEGQVINLADFGAFIDIGGIEGLVHLSELSWKRINKPSDILKVGDSVKVRVISIDQDKERLALSMKQLEADPWTIIDEKYHIGQLLEATVTKLTKYGAFARLHDDYGLEGLIHISELSEDHISHPNEVVKQAQKVAVRIIRIDPKQRQLGLSIKQVASDKYVEADLALLTAVEGS